MHWVQSKTECTSLFLCCLPLDSHLHGNDHFFFLCLSHLLLAGIHLHIAGNSIGITDHFLIFPPALKPHRNESKRGLPGLQQPSKKYSIYPQEPTSSRSSSLIPLKNRPFIISSRAFDQPPVQPSPRQNSASHAAAFRPSSPPSAMLSATLAGPQSSFYPAHASS